MECQGEVTFSLKFGQGEQGMYLVMTSIEDGLIYALVVLGLFLSYRILDIPDLTVDGSFTLGAAVSIMLSGQGHPLLGLLLGLIAGAIAGMVTAFLQTKMKVQPILAGIITMTGLYSVNLMVMDNKANIAIKANQSIFAIIGKLVGKSAQNLILVGIVVLLCTVAMILFLHTPLGLSIRATGDNEDMVRSSSINSNFTKTVGLSIANACVALSGALYAQKNCYAEVRMGIGMVVIGLASLIIGEIVVDIIEKRRTIFSNAIAAVIGSVLYRLIIAVALEMNLSASSLKLITAFIVAAAMSYPAIRESIAFSKQRKAGKTKC